MWYKQRSNMNKTIRTITIKEDTIGDAHKDWL